MDVIAATALPGLSSAHGSELARLHHHRRDRRLGMPARSSRVGASGILLNIVIGVVGGFIGGMLPSHRLGMLDVEHRGATGRTFFVSLSAARQVLLVGLSAVVRRRQME